MFFRTLSLSFVPGTAFDGETSPKARLPYGRFVVVQFSGRRPVSRIALVRRVIVTATGHRRIVAAPQEVQEVRLGLHSACNTYVQPYISAVKCHVMRRPSRTGRQFAARRHYRVPVGQQTNRFPERCETRTGLESSRVMKRICSG